MTENCNDMWKGVICFDNLTGQWSKWLDYGIITDMAVTAYWYDSWLKMDIRASWRHPSTAKHMDAAVDLQSDHQTLKFVIFEDSK